MKILKVRTKNLILIASIVWIMAGFSVSKIGVENYKNNFTVVNFFLSIVVFSIFHTFIFSKLVRKHTNRILNINSEKEFFWKFFDLKSFLIMVFMISFGILIRKFELVSSSFIAFFYTGLGLALFFSGILFGINYFKNLS